MKVAVCLLLLAVSTPAWAAPSRPTLTFTATPMSVMAGGVTTLEWSSTRSKTCQASGGWSGTLPPSGTEIRAGLTETTEFILTCTGGGRSVRSTVIVSVEASPPPPPPPPPPGTLMLQWQDNAGDETGFRVERLTNGTWAVIAMLGVNSTSYQDSPLTLGLTYCYRVAAFNAAGQSYSNEACGVAR